MSGFYGVRFTVGATSYRGLAKTPEVAATLSQAGFDPSEFNVIHWPMIGASRHAHAKILIDGPTLTALATDTSLTVTSCSLVFGPESAPTTVGGFFLAPIPLFVADRGIRIYALPWVDARFFWTGRLGVSFDFNVTGDDKSRMITGTAASESVPRTYAEIVDSIVTALGITVTGAGAATAAGRDVMFRGVNMADALDMALAESGSVFTAAPAATPTYTIRAIDSHKPADILDPLANSIQFGNAQWGDSVQAFVTLSQPALAWAKALVPQAVRVNFARFGDSTDLRPRVEVVTATQTPPAGFSGKAGVFQDVWDTLPALCGSGTVRNAASLLTRANLLAGWFYRRYVAGAMDVWCRGIVTPTACAAAKWVHWHLDAEVGFRTRIVSDLHDPLLGYRDASDDRGSGSIYDRRDTHGRVIIDHQRSLAAGAITAATGTVTGDFPQNILYSVRPNDNPNQPVRGSLAPKMRPVHGVDGKVIPAAVGSECIIRWGGYAADQTRDFVLMAADEALMAVECTPGGAVQRDAPDDALISKIITNRWGRVKTLRDGRVMIWGDRNLILEDEDFEAWEAILTNRHGRVMTNRNGTILIGRGATDDVAITWLERIKTNRHGKPITLRTGDLLLGRG